MNATKAKTETKPKAKPRTLESKRNIASEMIGASLKKYRHAKDISQEKLGLDAGVDRTYVSQIERGVGNPSVLTLANLCHILGITLADLFASVTVSVEPDDQTRRRNQAKLQPDVPKKTRLR